jgi:hypothetical protein
MKDDRKFQFFLAKLFGDLAISTSEGIRVIAYIWRDRIYVVEMFREVLPDEPKHPDR